MAKTEVKRDFKVLSEKISPENVLVMSELLAIKETKTLTRFMGSLAEKAHKKLCCDVFLKDLRGYVLSDCYDMVQSVAAFLCEHFGEESRHALNHVVAWRLSSANISENIWTISCISRTEGKGSR